MEYRTFPSFLSKTRTASPKAGKMQKYDTNCASGMVKLSELRPPATPAPFVGKNPAGKRERNISLSLSLSVVSRREDEAVRPRPHAVDSHSVRFREWVETGSRLALFGICDFSRMFWKATDKSLV